MGHRADGTPIRLADVETILPEGDQRAGVYFLHANGHKVWPWKEAGYYVDDDGEPLAPVFDVVPMPRAKLEALGLTDAQLWAEHERLFPGKRRPPAAGAPDVAELQVERRRVYDAVTAAWYGEPTRRD
jgi:hypothetical protein